MLVCVGRLQEWEWREVEMAAYLCQAFFAHSVLCPIDDIICDVRFWLGVFDKYQVLILAAIGVDLNDSPFRTAHIEL